MKVLLLIISSPGNEYKRFEDLWRYYMFCHKDIDAYFIEFRKQNDIYKLEDSKLYLQGEESIIPGCFRKTISSMKHLNYDDYDFVVRTNLSSMIQLHRLMLYLEEMPRTLYYAGCQGKYKNIPFCSGALFIMSKDIAEFLCSGDYTISNNLIDDVQIGDIINKQYGYIHKSLERQDVKNDSVINNSVFHYRFKTANRLNDISNYSRFLKETYPTLHLLGLKYELACQRKSDINEHVPTFYKYAKNCTSVVECGVRTVVSTWGFLKGLNDGHGMELTCCDLKRTNEIEELVKITDNLDLKFLFIPGNDVKIDLPDADIYFIDTWHVYAHLKKELERFRYKALKYIIMHDTEVDKIHGESIRCRWDTKAQSIESGYPEEDIRKGLQPAIDEFLLEAPEWILDQKFTNNNGLTIIKRIS